jgi:hypothetical protein
MAPSTGKRSQLIRDIAREQTILSVTDKELRRHLGPDIGGLNVKQSEGILVLAGIVEKIIMALAAINSDMESFVVGDRSVEIKAGETTITLEESGSIVLKTGDASIRMLRDGSIALKGKHLRIEGSGDVTVRASKELILKGQKIAEN